MNVWCILVTMFALFDFYNLKFIDAAYGFAIALCLHDTIISYAESKGCNMERAFVVLGLCVFSVLYDLNAV